MKRTLLALLLLLSLLLAACGTPPAAEPPALVSPDLSALLDQIRDTVQPGTAGASLRAAAAATALLDWAESAEPQDTVEATVSAWRAAQSEDALSRLPEQLESLRGMVERLTADYEANTGLLDDAGLARRGPWSEAAAQAALAALDLLG